MSNPISLANTIVLLAFTEFFQSRTEETSMQLTKPTLLGLSELRQQILSRLQGEPGVRAVMSIIETQGILAIDQLQPLVSALANAMQSDSIFADRISYLANAISQEPGVSNLLGRNIQSVARGTATQVNDPNSPTFTGPVSGSTFNIYYGRNQSPQTSLGGDSSTPTDATRRLELFNQLSRLPSPQFEQVIFALNPPPGNMPSSHAPQGNRVKALLDWSETIGPGLDTVEEIYTRVINPQRESTLSPQALIEHYLQSDASALEPADIRKIEKALQSNTLDASLLAQGCRLLRKEKGLDLIINQLNWIYELACIADGQKPRYFLPAPKVTGRLASTAWMETLLKQGLPGDYSCSIALTLGAFGVFIPEMAPPLKFLFINSKFRDEDRDAALIYLILMGCPEVITILIQAANMSESENSESEDYYLHSRGLFGLLFVDNVNVLEAQLHNASPHSELNAYAFGLAGSRDPQGRVLLETMKNHPNDKVRIAIGNALNSRWISAPRNANSIVSTEAKGLLAKNQTHQIQSALNLMAASYVDEWKLCFLTSTHHSVLEDALIKALSLGDQTSQHKAIRALCWIMGTTIQEWKSRSGLILGRRSPLWQIKLSSEKIQEIENFLQNRNLDPQTLAEGCLLLTKERGVNPVYSEGDWIYEVAVVADGAKPRRNLATPKPTGRLASVDWMKKFLTNEFPKEWSCWIAQTLGALGVFIPEMMRPLAFLFTDPKYTEADRDEALIYLAMLDIPQVSPILILAADLTNNDYYSSRGTLGLILLDNVDALVEQMLKSSQNENLTAYAYSLAGSRDPRGQVVLQKMKRNPNKNIRKAVESALAAPWNSL